MSETRTRKEKLLAMAMQTASPREAAIAQAILDASGVRVPRHADGSAHRTLSRDDIMGTPDVVTSRPSARVYDPSLRAYVVLDANDPTVFRAYGFSADRVRALFDLSDDEFDEIFEDVT